MKKFLCMTLLLTAMFLTFSACSSDDDEKTLYPVLNGLQSMLMITLLSSLLLIQKLRDILLTAIL